MTEFTFLDEDSYEIYDYQMDFQFKWFQEDNHNVYSYIIEQPPYDENQNQSEQATERKFCPNLGLYYIHNHIQPKSLDEAKQQVADWCKRTAYAIFHKKQSTLLPTHSTTNNSITDFDFIEQKREKTEEKNIILGKNELLTGLKQHIFGQDTALEGVAKVVSRHISRVDPKKPATIFSVGSSGVGKTKTANVLPEVISSLIDVEYHFLRLDMSEYQEQHRISQLVGAPQGYVGYGETSELVSTLRNNPRCIVLFDEIEKAHPAILKLLMNTIDAGRLSCATANNSEYQIDCSQAIFIFTSNLDAQNILNDIMETNKECDLIEQDFIARKRCVDAGIAPEIVGRMGIFVVYKPIDDASRAHIVVSSMQEIAEEFGLELKHIDPNIVLDILHHQSSNHFGARLDKMLIEDMISDALIEAKSQNYQKVKLVNNPIRCENLS